MTLLLCAVSGAWAQETLFLFQYDGSTTYGDGSNNGEFAMTATTGTAKFVTYEKKQATAGMTWASWATSITDDDLKPSAVSSKKKAMKLANNGAHIKITPSSGNFQAGDIIYICGYNPFVITTSTDPTSTSKIAGSDATVIASSVETGTASNEYEVGSCTLPNDFTETDAIYISRVQGGSSVGVAAIKVVRPAPSTDPTISADDAASITATESGVEVTKDIAVTGANLTGSTLTATLSPAVDGLSVTLASSTISDGSISTTATLHYTKTENASGTTTLTLSDGTTSKDVTITYKAKVVAATLKTISEAKTWDWTKVKAITTCDLYNTSDKAIKLSAETVPSITDDVVYTDYEGSAMTVDEAFDAEAIAFKGQYPIRQDKFCQNGTLHFKTSIPGSITVKFSDTGSSVSADAYKRYLNINGKNTEYWTSRPTSGTTKSNDTKTTDEIEVSAGDIYIKGMKEDEETAAAICVYIVTFTPATATATIATSGYTSLASSYALDFANAIKEDAGDDALTAYYISNITKTSVTLTSVEQAPAGEGLILKGSAGKTYTIPAIASADAITNQLSGAVTATSVGANTTYALSGGKLKLFTGTEIPAGKAYLLKSKVPVSANELTLDFGEGSEATGIESVEKAEIELLNGDFFNLAGQRVAQPTKGLYVVNGKKVIIK